MCLDSDPRGVGLRLNRNAYTTGVNKGRHPERSLDAKHLRFSTSLGAWFGVFRNGIGPQTSGKDAGGVRDDIGKQTSGKGAGGVVFGKNLKGGKVKRQKEIN